MKLRELYLRLGLDPAIIDLFVDCDYRCRDPDGKKINFRYIDHVKLQKNKPCVRSSYQPYKILNRKMNMKKE